MGIRAAVTLLLLGLTFTCTQGQISLTTVLNGLKTEANSCFTRRTSQMQQLMTVIQQLTTGTLPSNPGNRCFYSCVLVSSGVMDPANNVILPDNVRAKANKIPVAAVKTRVLELIDTCIQQANSTSACWRGYQFTYCFTRHGLMEMITLPAKAPAIFQAVASSASEAVSTGTLPSVAGLPTIPGLPNASNLSVVPGLGSVVSMGSSLFKSFNISAMG